MTLKKTTLILSSVLIFLLIFSACKKNSDNKVQPTEDNLAGTYKLTGLTWVYMGQTINVYDSLDDCEKDNLFRLNADLTLDFIDAGMVCSPPEDDTGTWYLSNDSLYLGDGNGAKIKSFDGTTLVLTGVPDSDPDVTATTTLKKQ